MAGQQSRLIKKWQKKGYFVINLVSCTPKGIPDLVALKPNEAVFIESKEGRDVLSPTQKIMIEILTKRGFDVYLNDDKQNL